MKRDCQEAIEFKEKTDGLSQDENPQNLIGRKRISNAMGSVMRWFGGALCLFIWLELSSPFLVRWIGVEVPAQKSEVWSFSYVGKFGKTHTAYRARVFYRWDGRFYQREFQIDKDRFVRLQKRELLKVAFLPLAPAWQPLLEGDFQMWTDRAALSFVGLWLNVIFWATVLNLQFKKSNSTPRA